MNQNHQQQINNQQHQDIQFSKYAYIDKNQYNMLMNNQTIGDINLKIGNSNQIENLNLSTSYENKESSSSIGYHSCDSKDSTNSFLNTNLSTNHDYNAANQTNLHQNSINQNNKLVNEAEEDITNLKRMRFDYQETQTNSNNLNMPNISSNDVFDLLNDANNTIISSSQSKEESSFTLPYYSNDNYENVNTIQIDKNLIDLVEKRISYLESSNFASNANKNKPSYFNVNESLNINLPEESTKFEKIAYLYSYINSKMGTNLNNQPFDLGNFFI